MSVENLATYLDDHYAGSVAALELLQRCLHQTEGTVAQSFFAKLHAEVEADQKVLADLMARLGMKQSRARKATAWIAEKLSRAKFNGANDPEDAGHLEALEFLYLGITGKAALWRALALIRKRIPALAQVDFEHLLERAERQRGRVEARRLKAAKAALVPTA